MFESRAHAANSEFVTIGAASRIVLDGLTLKIRSQSAPTQWPRNFPKRAGKPEGDPAKFMEEAHPKALMFARRSANVGPARNMRE
jgi:hypothetical protein